MKIVSSDRFYNSDYKISTEKASLFGRGVPLICKKRVLGTETVKWNFTKFLVGSDGTILKRYAPTDTPERITADLSVLLK